MDSKENDLPIKHDDGRWMYNKERLKEIFKKMSDKRKVSVLTKAIKIISKAGVPKWSAIAQALGCSYDDAGFWASKEEIRS